MTMDGLTVVDSVDKSQPSGLRVLVTNNSLGLRGGSELYARDLAIALMKRGHFPVAYSPVLGEVAEDLRRATVPVIDDLAALSAPPDIIHGHHHHETMTAALRFPGTPAISVCHGWGAWEAIPPVFPTIVRHVAVDDLCREWLLTTKGIAPADISVIYNFVDLDRFKPRTACREKVTSALIFSNYAGNDPRTQTIRAACARAGIERVDIVGLGSGNVLPNPEQVLVEYDVVFGKARCALEAMACGAAVIVADFAGLGGLVTTANVERMRRLNFGMRTMQAGAITEDGVLAELRRYDHEDARRVTAWIRAEADMSSAVTAWLSIYASVLARWRARSEHDAAAAREEQSAAASTYLRSLAPMIKNRGETDYKLHQATLAQSELAERLAAREAELAAKAQETAGLARGLAAREAQLDAIHASAMWKLAAAFGRLKAWFRRP